MKLIDTDETAVYILSKVLRCDKEKAEKIILGLAEQGWELREYKYHMTPARWNQMAEEYKGQR